MPNKPLQDQLARLHDELASATALDPALKRQLRDVANDIEARLGADAGESQQDASADLQGRVQQATVEFETEYPRLAHILGDLADTLSKLGI